ncbi:LysR substrate-binding domain-containing protein [Endozoicomonas sp. OPT23]|uniref:LysR substrate-binding domain-containing protein n=1 Tax=Endozoicomonas sp. OPT23 TaxID=2072845 RepID=UPI0018911F66|nr:LysR substrate-binding domain-containing protein [Endozoicomonas sp. OPT23]
MSPRLPSLVALKAFEAAARLGSFKAAAEELHVTPTAISHQIKTLEEQLQTALFTRRIRSIYLTDAGKALSPTITRAFGDISEAIDVVTARNQVITLSTTPSFATLFLVPRLIDFYEKYPQYSVQLDTSTQSLDLQRNRHIDLVIRYGSETPRGGVGECFLQETFGAYVASSMVLDRSAIRELPLIETEWQQNVLQEVNWTSWIQKARFEWMTNNIIRFKEESHVLQAAVAGKGIALASSVLVEDFLTRNLLKAYQPEVQVDGSRYQIIYRPESIQHRKVIDFIHWLQTDSAVVPL